MCKVDVSKEKYTLLSFDVEEFDIPSEYGYNMTLPEQVSLSEQGVNIILDLLKEKKIKSTFFCTTNFATHAQYTIKRIIEDGHEIASHGCNHIKPNIGDELVSKKILEKLFDVNIYGYRQPRMQEIDSVKVRETYAYNASLNPTFIPGRYANQTKSRTIFKQDGLVSIPSSVTPMLRFPLFWLSLHHLPICVYNFLVKRTLTYDGYFNTYFHPWEFIDLSHQDFDKIPYIIRHNSGKMMVYRLRKLIDSLIKLGVKFITYNEMTIIYNKRYETDCGNAML